MKRRVVDDGDAALTEKRRGSHVADRWQSKGREQQGTQQKQHRWQAQTEQEDEDDDGGDVVDPAGERRSC